MFELSFIRKYLTPRRKQLSVSLIALLSITVITLVVWLVVVFLSVTEGIERTWLHKLTALNAPVRLQPTKEYLCSYYYNVDRYSDASRYMAKTIGQKARALMSDPYNPEIDVELPSMIAGPDKDADGNLKDPVKLAFKALTHLGTQFPGLTFQDVELSGALMRLELIRQEPGSLYPVEMQSQLTNVSYLASFPENNPSMHELLLQPTEDDLNHLLFLKGRDEESSLSSLLKQCHIEKLKTRTDLWRLPTDLLPENVPFAAEAYVHDHQISHVMLPNQAPKKSSSTLVKRNGSLYYSSLDKNDICLDQSTPLFTCGNLELNVSSLEKALSFSVTGLLQNHSISGKVSLDGLQVSKAHFETEFETPPEKAPLWPYFTQGKSVLPHEGNETSVLVAKNFRDSGVRIGDGGYLAYSSPTGVGTQEIHIPIYVAGFYDPGIMAVGNKCILVPPQITQAINASNSAFTLDRTESNMIHVWLANLKDTEKVKHALVQQLHTLGIDHYWNVQTFREYDFAKDLMQQFESDKYLFTLIGIIILLVACTNIISLLVLLVSDKKKEIGILRAMGAKRRSIAAIFAFSGASLGLFSCLLGVFLAFITLKNIDSLVHFLSFIQGKQAFNAQFFGQSLPSTMSPRALIFAGVTTPILALLAGLLPAIKAARLNPCETLRSE